MNSFIDQLGRGTNLTLTENQAVTNASSLDSVVDFFALGGAKRDRPQDAVQLFAQAYATDKLTAIRTLFYLRDVRGGQGERRVFRACLKWLADNREFDTLTKVIGHVPTYGRWDDLSFMDYFPGIVGDNITKLIRNQLRRDLAALYESPGDVSLLAKWLPSENATSNHTKTQAKRLRHQLGYPYPRQYRLVLSRLRKHIKLLEQDMSERNWNEIQFDKLPSQAHRRHVKAFHRHTPQRYQTYLDSVQKGDKKINVSAVYPHEIYRMALQQPQYANTAWDALPDYTTGENALVMADVSASMSQTYNTNNPMSVSCSLALYFAERNHGAFKDHFMTFSSTPKLVKIVGKNLAEKFRFIEGGGRGHAQSTNLLAAFRAILEATMRSSREDCPKVLYVISDMEFDSANGAAGGQWVVRKAVDQWGRPGYIRQWVQANYGSADTIFETAKREFEEVGLTLPHVVFWNVQARQNQSPALAYDGHVSLVSGFSPTIFQQAVGGKTPIELVHEVVNGERYQPITL